VLGLLVARATATWSVQRGLRDGAVTRKWDPGLNVLGSFAASRPEGVRFVAAGWGVATQIFCFSQGRREFIHDVYRWYDGKRSLETVLETLPGKHTAYLVALDPPQGPCADETPRIFADAAKLDGWVEAPVEPELAAIGCVRAMKLVRSAMPR
jgi:hypothetical protein